MSLVRAFPRLHIGLVDLGQATPRQYGGAGFMLDTLPIEVSAEPGPQNFEGLDKLDRRGQTDVIAAIDRMRNTFRSKSVRIRIRRLPAQHVGLGTKTALTLAVLKATQLASALSGFNLGVESLQF